MERTIKVTGKGKLSVKPDTTRLLLTVEGTEPEYEQALERSAKQTKSIRSGLAGLGFAEDDLKTVSFQVDTKYEGYQDETGKWKQQFLGYQFSHSMKLEFPMDNERLGSILAMLVQSQAAPEFHIQYTIKEAEEVKREVLNNGRSGRGNIRTAFEHGLFLERKGTDRCFLRSDGKTADVSRKCAGNSIYLGYGTGGY